MFPPFFLFLQKIYMKIKADIDFRKVILYNISVREGVKWKTTKRKP